MADNPPTTPFLASVCAYMADAGQSTFTEEKTEAAKLRSLDTVTATVNARVWPPGSRAIAALT